MIVDSFTKLRFFNKNLRILLKPFVCWRKAPHHVREEWKKILPETTFLWSVSGRKQHVSLAQVGKSSTLASALSKEMGKTCITRNLCLPSRDFGSKESFGGKAIRESPVVPPP